MDNIYVIIAVIVSALSLIGVGIYWYKSKATAKQKEKVTQWLLWAVSEAESQLGSNTGQLKLAMVYDLFLTKFPKAAKAMSFAMFSTLVDKALDQMKIMIQSNPAIAKVITE
jgi:hypothetical protein